MPLSHRDPRGAQARPPRRRGATCSRWRTRRGRGVAGLDVDGRRCATEPASLRARARARPAPTRGDTSGLIGAGRYDEAYAVAAEVNPFPSVCGWICTAPCESACRRGVLDEPIAIRTLKRFAAEHGRLPAVEPPAVRADRAGGDRRRRARRHVRGLVPGPPRLPGHRARGDARAGRHDGHRDPRVPAAARRAAGGDRADPRGSASSCGWTRRWVAISRWPTSSARGSGDLPRDRRVQEPPPGGPWRRRSRGHPRDAVPQGGQPRRGAAPDRATCVVVGGGSTAMDAARSARRSGAATVTIVYRRGRADMPAQAEEIEAAEREGIVVLDGLAPIEVVGRDGGRRGPSLRRPARARRRAWRRRAGHRGRRSRREAGARGHDDPRRGRRGARPVHPPRGRRHRGQRLGRHRRRPGDAGDGPRRHLRRRRRRLRAEDDHRRGRRRPPRRRARSTSTSRASVDGEAEILAAVRYRTAAEALAHARPRRAAAGPRRRCRSSTPARSRPPRSASTTPRRSARRPGVSAATRSYGCPSVQVRAGRGPADGSSPDPAAMPVRRPGPPTSTAEARHDPGPGLRLLRCRRGFVEGTIAAALVVLWLLSLALHLGAAYMVRTTGKFTLRLGADLWWIIYVALARPHPAPGVPRQLHLLLPGRRAGQELPITGGLAAVCVFAVLLIKLVAKGDETRGVPCAGPPARPRGDPLHRARTCWASR